MPAPVAVHAWPQGLPQTLADLRGDTSLAIISVPTALTASRPEARQAIRHALQHTVATFLNLPVASVTLLSSPGQPVQVQAPGANLHIAISHIAGLSVAALGRHGAVGVDVMATPVQNLPDWWQVAHDYLGPVAAEALQRTPPAQGLEAFAQAWVSLEARLKCLGLGLTEWTPPLGQRLDACNCWPLDLAQGRWGAVARLGC